MRFVMAWNDGQYTHRAGPGVGQDDPSVDVLANVYAKLFCANRVRLPTTYQLAHRRRGSVLC
jgi:hypothetical protein